MSAHLALLEDRAELAYATFLAYIATDAKGLRLLNAWQAAIADVTLARWEQNRKARALG